MKKLINMFICVFLLSSMSIFANEADIVGTWITTGGDYVKIYKDNNLYSGEILKLVEPIYPAGHKLAGKEKIDTENPDLSQQSRKVTGMKFLWGFGYEDGKYKGGKIYNAGNGKTYYCKMEIRNNVLKVRGSLDKLGLAGSTQEWKKAN